MSEMLAKMCNAFEKKIKITCTDGEVLYGEGDTVTGAPDNATDGEAKASIALNRGGAIVEIYEDEIESIEFL